MPHSDKSTKNASGVRTCPYCGYPLRGRQQACPAHTDLLLLEPLDDRYLLTEDQTHE